MAKDQAELNNLESPQSRSEEFYNYLVGRSTNLQDLPTPKSRIEEYLEYLCYNNSGGGGPITIDQVTGLRDELDKKGDSLHLTDDKLTLRNGNVDLSDVPMITTAEVQLILNNLT